MFPPPPALPVLIKLHRALSSSSSSTRRPEQQHKDTDQQVSTLTHLKWADKSEQTFQGIQPLTTPSHSLKLWNSCSFLISLPYFFFFTGHRRQRPNGLEGLVQPVPVCLDPATHPPVALVLPSLPPGPPPAHDHDPLPLPEVPRTLTPTPDLHAPGQSSKDK